MNLCLPFRPNRDVKVSQEFTNKGTLNFKAANCEPFLPLLCHICSQATPLLPLPPTGLSFTFQDSPNVFALGLLHMLFSPGKLFQPSSSG